HDQAPSAALRHPENRPVENLVVGDLYQVRSQPRAVDGKGGGHSYDDFRLTNGGSEPAPAISGSPGRTQGRRRLQPTDHVGDSLGKTNNEGGHHVQALPELGDNGETSIGAAKMRQPARRVR